MRELALLLPDGVIVRDAGWICVADVMKSFHAFDTLVAFGTIVYAETLELHPHHLMDVTPGAKTNARLG